MLPRRPRARHTGSNEPRRRRPARWRCIVALILVILILLLVGGVGLLAGIVKGILAFGILGVLLLALIIAALLRPRAV